MDVYLNMAEDVAAQQAALSSMRQWLSRHTNLDGWEEDFSRQEQGVRQRGRAQANREMGDYQRNRSGGQRQPQTDLRNANRAGPAQAPAPSRQAGPRAGEVQDGYRFRGGDPANPQNWERVR